MFVSFSCFGMLPVLGFVCVPFFVPGARGPPGKAAARRLLSARRSTHPPPLGPRTRPVDWLPIWGSLLLHRGGPDEPRGVQSFVPRQELRAVGHGDANPRLCVRGGCIRGWPRHCQLWRRRGDVSAQLSRNRESSLPRGLRLAACASGAFRNGYYRRRPAALFYTLCGARWHGRRVVPPEPRSLATPRAAMHSTRPLGVCEEVWVGGSARRRRSGGRASWLWSEGLGCVCRERVGCEAGQPPWGVPRSQGNCRDAERTACCRGAALTPVVRVGK